MKPEAIYVWLVPSEDVQEQTGNWRIRKWDTSPFAEANFQCQSSESTVRKLTQRQKNAIREAIGFRLSGETDDVDREALEGALENL